MTESARGLLDGFAVVDRVPRAVFQVTGEAPLSYLHDVLAQDVALLTEGRGAIAAVLTPNGRVAAEVRVLPVDGGVLLDAEESARDGIVSHVARHAPLAGCEVVDVSDRFGVAAVRGSRADEAAAAALALPGADDVSFVRSGEVIVVRVAWGVPGIDVIGTSEAVASVVGAIPGRRAGVEELDAARIEAGRPRYGGDITEELLVNETPLLAHGVSMSKGCYPGQESVARIHNLGRIRRALRGLRSEGPLPTGTEVLLDGVSVGRVTSAAVLPGGGAAALALLSAHVAPGTTVRIDGTEAVVEELP